MAERMTYTDTQTLLLDDYEISNDQRLGLILAGYIAVEDQHAETTSSADEQTTDSVTVDFNIVELLREGADPDSEVIEINLDRLTICMLLSNRDGAWQWRTI